MLFWGSPNLNLWTSDLQIELEPPSPPPKKIKINMRTNIETILLGACKCSNFCDSAHQTREFEFELKFCHVYGKGPMMNNETFFLFFFFFMVCCFSKRSNCKAHFLLMISSTLLNEGCQVTVRQVHLTIYGFTYRSTHLSTSLHTCQLPRCKL